MLGEGEREAPAYFVHATFGRPESQVTPNWRTLLVAAVDFVSLGASVLIGLNQLAAGCITDDGHKRRLMIPY